MKIIFLIAVTGSIIWIALPKLLYLSSSSLGDGFTVFHQTLMSLVGWSGRGVGCDCFGGFSVEPS